MVIERINPLLNVCLKYALLHADKFKQKAIEMIKFGQKYNQTVIDKFLAMGFNKDELCINEFGDLFTGQNILIGNLVILLNGSELDDDTFELYKELPMVNFRDFN